MFENYPVEKSSFQQTFLTVESHEKTNFPLTITCSMEQNELSLTMLYKTSSLRSPEVETLMDIFEFVMNQITTQDESRYVEL